MTSTSIADVTSPKAGGRPQVVARTSEGAKRTLDVFGALLLLAMLVPFLPFIALLVAMDGGPVVFTHERIGRDGRRFGCLKFRTMVPGAAECLAEYLALHPAASDSWDREAKLARDPRVTPIGGMLRSTSIDELPQLLNVLRGEMSLVGPRPVVEAELPLYGDSAPLYLSLRPGLTGPWQVGGRSDTGYAERVRLDAAYAGHHSVLGDLAIILATSRVVLQRRGAR